MRGYSNYKNARVVPLSERLIAVLTYLTAGIVGFIWIILAYIAGKNLKSFVKFHAYQSLILSVLYALLRAIFVMLFNVVSNIPLVGSLVYYLKYYIFDFKIILGVSSICDFVVLLILAYLLIGSFLGKEAYIPKISDIIRKEFL